MDYVEAAEVFGLDVLHPAEGKAVLLSLDTLRELMDYASACADEVARGVYVAHGSAYEGTPRGESLIWDNREGMANPCSAPPAVAGDAAALAASDPAMSVEDAVDEVMDAAREEVDGRIRAALSDLRGVLLDRLAVLLSPSAGNARDLAAVDEVVSRLHAASELSYLVETYYMDWDGLLESPSALGPGELHDPSAYDSIALNACERQASRFAPTVEEAYLDFTAPSPDRAPWRGEPGGLAEMALCALGTASAPCSIARPEAGRSDR